jgi:hypothetical protein
MSAFCIFAIRAASPVATTLRTLAASCQRQGAAYTILMKWLIRLIDKDIVASLNSDLHAASTERRSRRFCAMLTTVYAPRLTWVKLMGPLLSLAIPLMFIHEPAKTYWMFACLGAIFIFFCLYLYRFALIRQQWLDKHEVDEFGACKASTDDRNEEPFD